MNSELLKVKDSLILISAGGSSGKIFKSLNNLETQIQISKSVRELNESKIRYNTYRTFNNMLCHLFSPHDNSCKLQLSKEKE